MSGTECVGNIIQLKADLVLLTRHERLGMFMIIAVRQVQRTVSDTGGGPIRGNVVEPCDDKRIGFIGGKAKSQYGGAENLKRCV